MMRAVAAVSLAGLLVSIAMLTFLMAPPSGQGLVTGTDAAPVGDAAERPPTKETLGRASWTLLHTFAREHPEEPYQDDVDYAREFVHAFARVYPCPECRKHLQTSLAGEHELKDEHLSSREALSEWVCSLHNLVNSRLGKEPFPCGKESLTRRWGDPFKEDCGCDADEVAPGE